MVRAKSGLHFTYRAFKHWYRAESLPPLGIVETVRGFGHSKIPVAELLDDGWGQRKGGAVRSARYGNNLTLENRRKGGSHSGELLKHRLGSSFGEYWKSFSSKGGTTSLERKTSLFRKAVGPHGEKMFNDLEVAVATCLDSNVGSYSYEPKLMVGKRILIPDFMAGRHVIECTSWMNAKEKAKALSSRFALMRAAFPSLLPLVVTSQRLRRVYTNHLQGRVQVVSLQEFQENAPIILQGLYRATGPRFTGARPVDFKES